MSFATPLIWFCQKLHEAAIFRKNVSCHWRIPQALNNINSLRCRPCGLLNFSCQAAPTRSVVVASSEWSSWSSPWAWPLWSSPTTTWKNLDGLGSSSKRKNDFTISIQNIVNNVHIYTSMIICYHYYNLPSKIYQTRSIHLIYRFYYYHDYSDSNWPLLLINNSNNNYYHYHHQ